MRRTLTLLSVSLLLVARAAGQAGGFTSGERAALERGELVSRPQHEAHADHDWIGGTSYARVQRPRHEVWRAVHDVGSWHSMLPQTSDTHLDSAAGQEELVGVEHRYGLVTATYTLRVRFDEQARRVSFEIASERPHDVRAAHGFLEVHAWPGDPSSALIVWAVLADPGGNPLVSMLEDEVQQWLLRVPSTMRGYLEGAGASRYRD
jgi:carbon monoxide dehydrogenase subunit G